MIYRFDGVLKILFWVLLEYPIAPLLKRHALLWRIVRVLWFDMLISLVTMCVCTKVTLGLFSFVFMLVQRNMFYKNSNCSRVIEHYRNFPVCILTFRSVMHCSVVFLCHVVTVLIYLCAKSFLPDWCYSFCFFDYAKLVKTQNYLVYDCILSFWLEWLLRKNYFFVCTNQDSLSSLTDTLSANSKSSYNLIFKIQNILHHKYVRAHYVVSWVVVNVT